MNRQQGIPDSPFQPNAFRGLSLRILNAKLPKGVAFLFLLDSWFDLIPVHFRIKEKYPNRFGHGDSCGTAKAEDPAGTLVTRRLKLSPRKAKWPIRLVLCISIHLIYTLSTV